VYLLLYRISIATYDFTKNYTDIIFIFVYIYTYVYIYVYIYIYYIYIYISINAVASDYNGFVTFLMGILGEDAFLFHTVTSITTKAYIIDLAFFVNKCHYYNVVHGKVF
jgi:hypothetical protein